MCDQKSGVQKYWCSVASWLNDHSKIDITLYFPKASCFKFEIRLILFNSLSVWNTAIREQINLLSSSLYFTKHLSLITCEMLGLQIRKSYKIRTSYHDIIQIIETFEVIKWILLPRTGQMNSFSYPLGEKKSCATREKHSFYLCCCYPCFARASNFTLAK